MEEETMKKIFYSIITAVLALSACQKVDFKPQDSDKVDIRFDVRMPAGNWGTKALAENPDLKSLHVALFDENGYKVDMTEAELISINNTDRTYTYSIRVTSTDEPRIMHFLGNCPADKAAEIADSYGNEMTLLTDIVCENEQDAYWQKKLLSKGIPSDPGAAKNEIGPVELVRNYANIVPEWTIEKLYDYTVPGAAPGEPASPLYDVAGFHPQVVVIFIGINDFQGEPPYGDKALFKKNYAAFLEKLRKAHPGVKFLLVSTKIWPNDDLTPTVKAIYDAEIASGHSDLDFLTLQTENSALLGHPSVHSHVEMANTMRPIIARLAKWLSR